MANNVDEWIPLLAEEWNTQFEQLDDGVTWAIDVPFKMNDSELRKQWVYVTYGVGVAKGNDIYDIRSKVGDYSPGIDLYGLLHEAKYGFYSIICIRELNREDIPIEVIFVQAGPLAEHVGNYEQFKFIIEEVGSNADILEKKFYGGIDKT